eukprot:comp16571_c0_seq1/m.14669 comp16571_c0_seq1/g.14669  ORF comp16571_c0_seq1/g.14669 comp16571_c0_seq1/m.14669 type:complete len:330 (-) comp16571_c0_seq1:201-1190(-)
MLSSLTNSGFSLNKLSLALSGPKDDSLNVTIKLDGDESRRCSDNGFAIYADGETVKGQVVIDVKPGFKYDHQGIKVEFIGSCDLIYDKSNSLDFVSLARHLAPAGELSKSVTYDFEFARVEKPYDSYHGARVKLRYIVKVTLCRGRGQVEKERELWVQQEYDQLPGPNPGIKLEVGIEEALHIECEYAKSKYHLQDAVIGRVYFSLVRLKLKMMEVAIVKREATGLGGRRQNHTETIAKFEIMEGSPGKGETIPIRLFLGAYELGPTFQDVCKRFSVAYYLNLVMVDEADRRYFKQEEITLYRKALGAPSKPPNPPPQQNGAEEAPSQE